MNLTSHKKIWRGKINRKYSFPPSMFLLIFSTMSILLARSVDCASLGKMQKNKAIARRKYRSSLTQAFSYKDSVFSRGLFRFCWEIRAYPKLNSINSRPSVPSRREEENIVISKRQPKTVERKAIAIVSQRIAALNQVILPAEIKSRTCPFSTWTCRSLKLTRGGEGRRERATLRR